MEILLVPPSVGLLLALAILLGARGLIRQGGENIRKWQKVWQKIYSHLPVSPLTKLVTNSAEIERRARVAFAESRFRPESVLKYKELSFWGALILIFFLAQNAPPDQAFILGVILIFLAYRWPELYLSNRAAQARRGLIKGLTQVIDLLGLYVSAGQNLETAMRSVAESSDNRWGAELKRMVYRLDSGFPLREVFSEAARELNLPDFNKFILSLEQSRVLGASLSGTLSVQASLLRQRRRNSAESSARSASVKISLPLVLCIFPALLIVYLAPAVLRLMGGL